MKIRRVKKNDRTGVIKASLPCKLCLTNLALLAWGQEDGPLN